MVDKWRKVQLPDGIIAKEIETYAVNSEGPYDYKYEYRTLAFNRLVDKSIYKVSGIGRIVGIKLLP